MYAEGYKENVAAIRHWLKQNIGNLLLVGRNGMHVSSIQDDSKLPAYLSAQNLFGQSWDPSLVDAEYLEDVEPIESGSMVPRCLPS